MHASLSKLPKELKNGIEILAGILSYGSKKSKIML